MFWEIYRIIRGKKEIVWNREKFEKMLDGEFVGSDATDHRHDLLNFAFNVV